MTLQRSCRLRLHLLCVSELPALALSGITNGGSTCIHNNNTHIRASTLLKFTVTLLASCFLVRKYGRLTATRVAVSPKRTLNDCGESDVGATCRGRAASAKEEARHPTQSRVD